MHLPCIVLLSVLLLLSPPPSTQTTIRSTYECGYVTSLTFLVRCNKVKVNCGIIPHPMKVKGGIETYHMKSLQWLQNVGCLKNLGMKGWSLTINTFFFLRAPFLPRCPRPNWVFMSLSSSSWFVGGWSPVMFVNIVGVYNKWKMHDYRVTKNTSSLYHCSHTTKLLEWWCCCVVVSVTIIITAACSSERNIVENIHKMYQCCKTLKLMYPSRINGNLCQLSI